MFQMASAVSLTALIDFYNLKKEGKVALVNGQPCLTSNKSSIEGVFPILAHLNTKTNILGESALEQALVRQWITFQVQSDQSHLPRDPNNTPQTKQVGVTVFNLLVYFKFS